MKIVFHKYPLVEGYNTCEKCLERCRKNAKRMNEIKTDNGYFRTSNKLFFLSSIIQKVNKIK